MRKYPLYLTDTIQFLALILLKRTTTLEKLLAFRWAEYTSRLREQQGNLGQNPIKPPTTTGRVPAGAETARARDIMKSEGAC